MIIKRETITLINAAPTPICLIYDATAMSCYNKPMQIEFLPIKTRIVHPPQDDIWDIIESLEVKDGDIVFITSKIIAIHQGRTRKVGEIGNLFSHSLEITRINLIDPITAMAVSLMDESNSAEND